MPPMRAGARNFIRTNAIWRLSAHGGPARARSAGTGAEKPQGAAWANWAPAVDWRGTTPLDPFANLNTLADLVAAGPARANGS